ncbi:CBS domain-containing protein [Pseudanabaena sp. FACHB-1998]|uniref:CBS domain-containing protein n=1 Tax=Pseudanabaena sp. FACHB-1998 TaxID=2692858 RepID=UPI001680D91D|nr:CBS domain-containing protein [Pseudanabaena sp. FACHB-1998]MBD2177592.1 CBS domain-containing protein [Pseudanabaena sp. FACHB-1998]
MQLDTPLDWIPDLTSIIEYSPLIVTPATPLLKAIALISQSHSPSCSLKNREVSLNTIVLSASSIASSTASLDAPLTKTNQSQTSPSQTNPSPSIELRTSCVLVKQNQSLVGILTARDVVRLTAQEIDFQNALVGDFMTSPVITMPQRSLEDIFAALFLFRRYQIRHLPLVDEQGELIGVISHENIRHILRPANLLKFRRVADVMTSNVIHAHLEATILELVQLMNENRVSCVVIIQTDQEGNQRPVGIVTERDIVQFHAFNIDLANTTAATVMSTPLFLLSPEDSLWTAHQEMTKRRISRMVVSWNWGNGLGIITQTSLLKIFDPLEMYGVIENMQQTIQQLETETAVLNFEKLSTPVLADDSNGQGLQLVDIYTDIKYLQDNLNLDQEERRSRLQSILNNLQTFL